MGVCGLELFFKLGDIFFFALENTLKIFLCHTRKKSTSLS